jgi:hypothetical protein
MCEAAKHGGIRAFLPDFLRAKIEFATVDRFVYFGGVDPSAKSRSAPLRGGGRIVI